MRREPKPYEIFTHFKGKKYQIITLATHSETREKYVVYQAMYDDFRTFVRPYDMFMSETDHEKYPDTPHKYRFFREDEDEEVVTGTACESVSEAGVKAAELKKEQIPSGTETVSETAEKAEVKTAADLPAGSPEAEDTSEWNIDPLVIEFLDADTHEARLNILAALFPRITDEMINTMAVAIDIEIDDGPIEQRYAELKNCIQTKIRYERRRQ